MASRIAVDTGKVLEAANRLSQINNQIDDDFEKLETAIKHLSSEWHSNASEAVIGHFHQIKDTLKENRHKVMDQQVKFLKMQVSDGYNVTETNVTRLADAFK
ncbi:WXG100 family type VII secretion target [Neobacillus sp. Marseille-QA0830]